MDQKRMSLDLLTASLNVPRRSVPAVPRVERVSRADLRKSYKIPISTIPTIRQYQKASKKLPIRQSMVELVEGETHSVSKTNNDSSYQSPLNVLAVSQPRATIQMEKRDIFNAWPNGKDLKNNYNQNQNRKQNKWYLNETMCGCSFCCLCLCLLAVMVLAMIIAAILVALIKIPTPTTPITSISSAYAISTTSITSITTTTDIPCSTTCSSQQTCVQGTCVGIGYLSCTLTWSRDGDGDIVVATPNNKIIYYSNTGPSNATDQGQLDVDDRYYKGPENVFWSNSGSVPPTGTYYVCFSQFSFSPSTSSTNPITATVKVVRSASTTLTFTKTFTSPYENSSTCDSASGTLLGSFSYP